MVTVVGVVGELGGELGLEVDTEGLGLVVGLEEGDALGEELGDGLGDELGEGLGEAVGEELGDGLGEEAVDAVELAVLDCVLGLADEEEGSVEVDGEELWVGEAVEADELGLADGVLEGPWVLLLPTPLVEGPSVLGGEVDTTPSVLTPVDTPDVVDCTPGVDRLDEIPGVDIDSDAVLDSPVEEGSSDGVLVKIGVEEEGGGTMLVVGEVGFGVVRVPGRGLL